MTDALDIYNNTGSDIVCANGTIPASSYISIVAGVAAAWAKDPIVVFNLWQNNIGVEVFGIDFGYGFNSQADVWMKRVAEGSVLY